MDGPRPIDAILFELEEIECTGIDFDDPAADYQRRFQRPEDLQEEARALGPGALEVLLDKLARSPKEDGVGTLRRRPFLCEVVGALAPRRPEVVGAALLQLRPRDVQQIIAALPKDEAASTVGTWFRAQQEGARKAKDQGTPKLRVMLLSAYADLARPTPDDPIVALARTDPSPAVQKCAEGLTR